MYRRRSNLLTAMALIAAPVVSVQGVSVISPNTCPAPQPPVIAGPIAWWDTSAYVAANNNILATAGAYTYVPDGCGLGGQIGFRFYQGGPNPSTNFNTANYGGYPGKPYGSCPDGIMSPLFGTFEQSVFSSENTLCSVRFYTVPGSGVSFMLDIDFSQSDCTNKGAPSAGATYAGTVVGFSDYISGATSTQYTTITYMPTVLGGGQATELNSWKLYNSNQADVSSQFPGTSPFTLQQWVSGTQQGARAPAPPGTLGVGYDTNFGILSLPNTERYTALTVTFSTEAGGNDFSGFVVGNAPALCPDGSFFNAATGLCDTCPKGTYYFGGATPLDCMPCPKGQTTIGCGATSVNQCHKPCGAGSFYNVQSKACQKCPAGTFFPGTGFGKTQLLETTECIPCPGSTKVGATTCRAYAKNATHNNGGKAWKKARV